MHSYKVLTTKEEIHKHLIPALKANGQEIPPDGYVAAAAEFDESGELVAYQMIQNAIFLEGLWSKDKSTHLRRLHGMALDVVRKLGSPRVMCMTRQDEQGKQIGRLAVALGYEPAHWDVYRRNL